MNRSLMWGIIEKIRYIQIRTTHATKNAFQRYKMDSLPDELNN